MRPGVLFLDCYGTLVEGDRPVIQAIVAEVAARAGTDPDLVDRPWWRRFAQLCAEARGADFRTQYELEVDSLTDVLAAIGTPLERRFVADALTPLVDYWRGAQPYPDAVEFLTEWTACPAVIVSNIDRADIDHVLRLLPPVTAVVTSEDARAYKPHRTVFDHALALTNVSAHEALHVGDSWESDVVGATSVGIPAVHVVRGSASASADASGKPSVARISSFRDLGALISV